MNQKGFTLIELMVSLAVASIVMAAVYLMYHSQLQTNATQLATVEMSQHARAAIMLLEREIRSAGTDPTGYANAGFLPATNANVIHFTRDLGGGELDSIDNDKDGQTDEGDEWYDAELNDPNENIRYALTGTSLGRETGGAGGLQRVADNVEVLNFVYLDASGNPTATLADTRAVQVTIIARSDNPVLMRDQTDRTVYRNLQGQIILDKSAAPDTIRRIMLSSEIRVRNMGLK